MLFPWEMPFGNWLLLCCQKVWIVADISKFLETTQHLLNLKTCLGRTFCHLQFKLQSAELNMQCEPKCFSILDRASTTFQLKIKEAIHIQWEKPTLNHRLYHLI